MEGEGVDGVGGTKTTTKATKTTSKKISKTNKTRAEKAAGAGVGAVAGSSADMSDDTNNGTTATTTATTIAAATATATATDSDADPRPAAFYEDLFLLLARYAALEGKGWQAAVPQSVLPALRAHFGVSVECFSSPLNCYLPWYCSLFPDVDAPFGSCGSFFDWAPTCGSFEANPPFVPQVRGEG